MFFSDERIQRVIRTLQQGCATWSEDVNSWWPVQFANFLFSFKVVMIVDKYKISKIRTLIMTNNSACWGICSLNSNRLLKPAVLQVDVCGHCWWLPAMWDEKFRKKFRASSSVHFSFTPVQNKLEQKYKATKYFTHVPTKIHVRLNTDGQRFQSIGQQAKFILQFVQMITDRWMLPEPWNFFLYALKIKTNFVQNHQKIPCMYCSQISKYF